MNKKFQSLRGMNDIEPSGLSTWKFIESRIFEIFASSCIQQYEILTSPPSFGLPSFGFPSLEPPSFWPKQVPILAQIRMLRSVVGLPFDTVNL